MTVLLFALTVCAVASAARACECHTSSGSLNINLTGVVIVYSAVNGSSKTPTDSNACKVDCTFNLATNFSDSLVEFTIVTCKDLDGGSIDVLFGGGRRVCKSLKSCNDKVYFNSYSCSDSIVVEMHEPPNPAKPMQVTGYAKPVKKPPNFSPPTGATVPVTTTMTTSTESTTTSSATTTAPPSQEQNNDPASLQAELAIAIDQNSDDFYRIQRFANSTVYQLTVHTNVKNITGVRLALQWINETAKGTTEGSFWGLNTSAFANAVNRHSASTAGPSLYKAAIQELINSAFALSKLRPKAQRILLILTSNDASDNGPLIDSLVANDVHPMVVNFGTEDLTNIRTIVGSGNVEPFDESGDPTTFDDDVKKLLQKTILNGDTLCPISEPTGEFRIIKSANFQDEVTLGVAGNDTKGRYCSYQNRTINIARTDDEAADSKDYFIMTVKYELETEADYIRIVSSNGTEQAFFSGYDVVGSRICFKETNATFIFKSNSQQVFRGFIANATFVSNCPSP